MPLGVGSARDVRPYWGRVTVVESPLDEEETAGGLIVPRSALASAGDDPQARRGIVKAVSGDLYEEGSQWRVEADRLAPGMVVYFRYATRIQGDVLTVEFNDILAVET